MLLLSSHPPTHTHTHTAVCMSDYSRCDFRNVVNFSTNLLSYEGATPTVHINLNATDNLTTHYYTLCHSRPNTDKDKLMECLASNKSQFDTVVKWRYPGLTTLIVAVYNDSSYNETSSFVDCDTADILVASESMCVCMSVWSGAMLK